MAVSLLAAGEERTGDGRWGRTRRLPHTLQPATQNLMPAYQSISKATANAGTAEISRISWIESR
jgi:hypothetical protein